MKKYAIIVISFLTFFAHSATAQLTMTDLVEGKSDVVFLGLDFTHAKFVGSYGFQNPYTIQYHHLEEWNRLMLREFQKYSLHEALRLDYYQYKSSFDHHIKMNKQVVVKEVITNDPYRFELDLVQKIVETYSIEKQNAIGISFIVESFDKNLGKASIWVTFIDLNTGEFIYSEKLQGEATGVGFRNYWARSVYEVINHIKYKRFRMWRREF